MEWTGKEKRIKKKKLEEAENVDEYSLEDIAKMVDEYRKRYYD